MDPLEHALLVAVVAVSHALDPVVAGIGRLNSYIHSQLFFLAIPLVWHDGIVAALWVVMLFMLFRTLTGWLRLVMLMCTILVVAKMWGYLPV